MRGVAKTKLTPDMLTLAGVSLCLGGAVLVGFEERNEKLFFWLGGLLFVVGSVADILDGALARAASKGTVFGAFLDSTFDRLGEAAMLTAIGLVFMRDGNEVALVATFAAVIGSFLVSYTRAKAEALGLRGDVGFGSRASSAWCSSRSASGSPRGACSSGRSTSSPRWRGSRWCSACSSCDGSCASSPSSSHRRIAVARWAARAHRRRAVDGRQHSMPDATDEHPGTDRTRELMLEVLALWLLAITQRAGILVRMPAPLKGRSFARPPAAAPTSTTSRPAFSPTEFGVSYTPTRSPPQSASRLMPPSSCCAFRRS